MISFQTCNAAQDFSKGEAQNTAQTGVYHRRTDAAMAQWRADRFGIFIHFGLYSEAEGWWHGKEIPFAAEWISGGWKGAKRAEYEQMIHQFNPKNFNATAWAQEIKKTGAKYVVLTTKHHEGFCLWPTQYNNFNISDTPYKQDFLKQFTDAMHAAGLDVGLYYSILDWHNPDYRSDLKTAADLAAMQRYVQYVKNQLTELLTHYGDIKLLWFDGTWEPSWRKHDFQIDGKQVHVDFGADLDAYLRKLKPGLIINSRLRRDMSVSDYDSGYERRLPVGVPDMDWESCMTMTENSWGYHRTWSGNGWKTPKTMVEMLAKSAAKGGNFLLNIGPKPDGTIRDKETARLDAIGDWMAVSGNAIYGTQGVFITDVSTKAPATVTVDLSKQVADAGGADSSQAENPKSKNGDPYEKDIFLTQKDAHTFYLFVFDWPPTDHLVLNGFPTKIASAKLLTPKGEQDISVIDGKTLVGLPMTEPNPIGSVIKLTLE